MDIDEAPLEGKVAVVTGASRNIGRAIAKRLADYGVAVVINALQDRESADAVAHEIFEDKNTYIGQRNGKKFYFSRFSRKNKGGRSSSVEKTKNFAVTEISGRKSAGV